MSTENDVWSGSTSQIANIGTYIVCGLLSAVTLGALALVAVPFAIWKFLATKNQSYELTTQRLKTHSGVLSKKTDELELYRVKDTRYEQPFFLRLFGLGNIVLISSDSSTPFVKIEAVKDAKTLREQIRTLIEQRRDQKRVRVAELE